MMMKCAWLLKHAAMTWVCSKSVALHYRPHGLETKTFIYIFFLLGHFKPVA